MYLSCGPAKCACQISLHFCAILDSVFFFFFYMYFLARREAVRQRKALSRTSSNILLNSVQMGHHNPHNVNQYHHISYNHPSDCDINAKLKDLKEEDSQESVSNIEVIEFSI